jgi:glutathione S-transferase
MSFVLYAMRRSGPAYKVALMLRLCRAPFTLVEIDLDKNEHKTPEFLQKSRFGQVPCLEHKGHYFCQSPSILDYLASALKKFQGADIIEQTHIREWLCWDLDKLSPHLFRQRGVNLGFKQAHPATTALDRETGAEALALLNQKLMHSQWLIGCSPTIADINVYGVAHIASIAGFNLDGLDGVVSWMRRLESLPGYEPFSTALPPSS